MPIVTAQNACILAWKIALPALSGWDMFGFSALFMVLIGVGLEVWVERRIFWRTIVPSESVDPKLAPKSSSPNVRKYIWKWERNNRKWKHRGEFLLVVGLALELVSYGRQIVETANSNERANKAKLELEKIRMHQWPRSIQFRQSDFMHFLKGKATGVVQILYIPEDEEAEEFASELSNELSMSGWPNRGYRPIPSDMVAKEWQQGVITPGQLKRMSLQQRATGTSASIALLSKGSFFPPANPPAIGVLAEAIGRLGFSIGGGPIDGSLLVQLYHDDAMNTYTESPLSNRNDRASFSSLIDNMDKSFMSNWVVVVIGKKE